jgi:hypothetical protein
MDAHYERLGIRKRWDKQRVDRLCGFLRMNYGELSSLLHTPHDSFCKTLTSIKPFSGSLSLLLTVIEHRYLQHYTKDTIPNPFNFTEDGK